MRNTSSRVELLGGGGGGGGGGGAMVHKLSAILSANIIKH